MQTKLQNTSRCFNLSTKSNQWIFQRHSVLSYHGPEIYEYLHPLTSPFFRSLNNFSFHLREKLRLNFTILEICQLGGPKPDRKIIDDLSCWNQPGLRVAVRMIVFKQ